MNLEEMKLTKNIVKERRGEATILIDTICDSLIQTYESFNLAEQKYLLQRLDGIYKPRKEMLDEELVGKCKRNAMVECDGCGYCCEVIADSISAKAERDYLNGERNSL